MISGINTRSLRPLLMLFSGNFLGMLAGGVFFLVAARSFDLKEMGFYAVAISIQWIFSGLLGTGLGVATIRLASDYCKSEEYPKAAGIVALTILIVVAIAFSAIALYFGIIFFNGESIILPDHLLILVFCWAGGRSVLECLRSGLLAQRHYNRVGLLMLLNAMIGLTALAIASLGGPLTLKRLLLAHAWGMGISALVGLGFLTSLWKSGIHLTKGLFKELLKYSRWPFFSEGVKLLQIHIGPFVLMAVSGAEEAGLFTLGRYPAYIFGIITLSLYQYWLPEVTRKREHKRLVHFFESQMRLAAAIGLIMLLGALILRPVLPFLGSNFEAAASLFLINTLDFAILVLIIPIETIYHGLYKPQLVLIPRAVCLPLLMGFAFVLAHEAGATGMAWAQVLSGLATLLFGYYFLKLQLNSAALSE